MNIIECRACGAAYWSAAVHMGRPVSGAIAGGPCCRGIAVLDIERYPTEKAALNAYPAWRAADLEAMRVKWKEHLATDAHR